MKIIIAIAFALLCSIHLNGQKVKTEDLRTLIVFFDGLRPDYISNENMPNLYAFSKKGSVGNKHHSVFPTVTRVNSPSYATGSYPKSHGIMGNSVFFPEIVKNEALNTGSYDDLLKIDEFTHGKLLTAESLGEAIHREGHHMMVFSSGSAGQAFLQNHSISGGAVINSEIILPESLKESLFEELGSIPEKSKPNSAQHKWMTNALISRGLRMDGPLVSAIWYSDPDGTAHSEGIGAPASIKAIQSVDKEFGDILKALEQKGLSKNFNIIVSTDHGFITNVGKESLTQFLIDTGLKANQDSDDIVVAGGAIHLKDKTKGNIEKIVHLLQEEAWVGAIFTKADLEDKNKGFIDGTLSFESIHWNHPSRSADILVSVNWNDDKNEFGFAGTSYARGTAGHGGISPYEINIKLLASGPSFKSSFQSDFPSSNVDIVPTILKIHDIDIPESVDGRVLTEMLKENDEQATEAKVETLTVETTGKTGVYKLSLQRTIYGEYIYVDFAKIIRTTIQGK
jgi:predicted AlkP superfamily pyrophosphatase or phosphodiesterase